MHLGRTCALVVASLSLIPTSPAQADVPRRRGPCDSLEVGAPCDEGGRAGTCIESSCPRLSYSGGERKIVRYPCRMCEPTPAKEPPAAEDHPEDEPATPEDDTASTKSEDGEASAKVAVEVVAAGETSSPAAEPERKGLCAVDPRRGGASLLFVLGLALLRRRR